MLSQLTQGFISKKWIILCCRKLLFESGSLLIVLCIESLTCAVTSAPEPQPEELPTSPESTPGYKSAAQQNLPSTDPVLPTGYMVMVSF